MNGDADEQFERFVRYYKRVLTLFHALGFSREDARDLTQDTFLRVYQHMKDYRGDAIWGYLQITAKRVAMNHIRDIHTIKRTAIMESEEKLKDVSDTRIQPADKTAEARQASDWLHRAVDRLDLNQRACMRLYLKDFSYVEIAQGLGLTESAVKSRLNLARKRLQEMVGDDLEDFGDEP
ncbi:MAG TPA: sigma-70 family RNA polymerase sigma factor [Thermoanaerobaculia bacterium]|jgi:RNA polymerase sigma-70 factor (ECF subfamily)|nr:sigma-70 family RNA polymerase sigma factor [Thermoanaerobaculia bacterium]